MFRKYFKILIKHFHIVLYFYFWLGIFIGGLIAPKERIDMLNSSIITEGWHISLLSLILIGPVFIIYYSRMRKR
jgi:hypothetical protein